MSAADVLAPFIGVLNLDRLRLTAPQRFIFFCGGKIVTDRTRPASLRDFLLREFQTDVGSSIDDVTFILAEVATQMFRDSKYSDLIAFEEDIAHISDIVWVIAESPGSLTELGAFSMNETIARRLKVIVRDDHYDQESFIRHGPLKHLENQFDDAVSAYPWRVYSDGSGIVRASARPNTASIREEIRERLTKVGATETFDATKRRHRMIVVCWIIHILRAATLSKIIESLRHLRIDETEHELKKILYCLRFAAWISERKYGHTFYYFPRIDKDPFDCAFNETAPVKDAARWKSITRDQLTRRELKRPSAILALIGA